MAKNFEGVIEELAKVIKKPMEGRAPVVLAVQMVDKTGKVITEEKGAAAAEAQREEEKRGKKTVKLLETIAKSLGGKKKLPGRDPKTGRFVAAGAGDGFLKSMLPGLLPAAAITALGGMSVLGKLGIGAIAVAGVWSAVLAIGDGLDGIEWAKSMGMEKESGFIARFFAGDIEGGLMNAFKQSMTGAAMGATLGMAGGPVGMIVGALLGAALFGIAGYFGAGALAKMIDPLVQDARKLFGLAVNVTPEELEDAKAVAATTLQLKDDAIATVKGFTDQIVAAQAATEPDQELIDNLILLKAKAMRASVEAHKKHEEAATKALELDRQAERSAVIAAEDAVARNKVEILRLNVERRRFEREVKLYGEDTLEGQVAAANLAATRVKLRKTRTEGETLREEEAAAEAVLLEEDRRLIKEAKEKGGTAPWRARFNVWTTDTWNDLKESWSSLKTWAVTWFANNIFDSGSAGDDTGSGGSPMRIFGVAIPSMEEVTTKIKESWSTLKTSAISWFKDNIFDSGSAAAGYGSGTPMRIFGVAIPSMKEVTDKIEEKWNTLKTWATTWFKDNIFDSGTPMRIFGYAIPSMEEVTDKIEEKWNTLKTWAVTWFKDNIFDSGSAAAGYGSGTPMRIFGYAIPSMEEVTDKIEEKWNTLKTWATEWFAKYIYSPAGDDGTPAKLFGVELKWPEITLPDFDLKLPDWLTEADFFTFDWPDINIKDLTEGLKNLVRGLLPDPVNDPWMYKLMPQKIYDWLGVSTAQREAEAEMAKANGELQKLELKRTETAAIKVKGEEGGPRFSIAGRLDTANERAEELKDIDAEILETNKRIKIAEESMAKAALTNSPNGSIFTHDQGLHDRLDKIFPPSVSGQRAAAMTQAGIQRGMGGGAGGGITSINTGGNVVSAPTTNYVNNGIAARRPVVLSHSGYGGP